MNTDAIVLNVRPQMEHHSLVELFTHNGGRLRAFARYSQSKKPRFGGLLNTFNHVHVKILDQSSGHLLVEVQHIESFSYIKQHYQVLSIGYQMLNALRSMTPLNMANESVFDILLDQLHHLNQPTANHADCLRQFYRRLVADEGIHPNPSNYTETEYEKMIESYSGTLLRRTV